MAEEGAPSYEPKDAWQVMLEAAFPAIVALQVTAVRSFQDERAGAHGGTGFVVDAERGLLLTNRHVCTCGPARAAATFVGWSSMEELPVEVVYVDPAHDFAFLRFDPKQLRQTPHAEIKLEPAGCRVGAEIRICGNDSMEKLQILTGTIARIDRNVPTLDQDYQDENTFYALAGSGSRGGSSGSPVLNHKGCAIALNAAARGGTMHSIFLPLQRVVRALAAIRGGEAVPRGTLCAAFGYAPLPECLRLGVPEDFVQRSVLGGELPPGGTFSKASPPGGMLKVERCISGSVASTLLQAGDVLLELEGQPCVDFVLLEAILDGAVGGSVRLALCRGGQTVQLEVAVQDLHRLIPHEFIEMAAGVFHEVPYQTAQKHHIPLKGVYVAQAGFVFGEVVKSDSLILGVNGVPCNNLHDFEAALLRIAEKEHFTVTWMSPGNGNDRRKHEGFVKMQRCWCPFRAWTLDRATRAWSFRQIGSAMPATGAAPPSPCPDIVAADASDGEAPVTAGQLHAAPKDSKSAASSDPPPKKKSRKSKLVGVLAALDQSVCTVVFRTLHNFDTDLNLDANDESADVICRRGVGIVVEADAGFVLTDRVTVPQPLGDIAVSLGEVSCSASVWFVHPLHSFVVLRLDETPAKVSKKLGVNATFEDHEFEAGEDVDFVGLDPEGQRFTLQVTVQCMRLEAFPRQSPPRWRERNLEAVFLVENPPNATSGVLCSASGHIYALFSVASATEEAASQFGFCLPVWTLLPLVAHLRGPNGTTVVPAVPSLEVEFQNTEIQMLRRLPSRIRPSAAWLTKLSMRGSSVLQLVSITANGPCDGLASEGDLLVAVDGNIVTNVQSVEERLNGAVADGSANNNDEPLQVRLTLLTHGQERNVCATVPLLGSDGSRRVICWHGLVLLDTPRFAREFGPIPEGVSISRTLLGSPGEADGIEGDYLVAVDGVPTPTLEAVDAVSKLSREDVTAPATRLGERRHLRVETADICGRRFVAALEPDPLFWQISEVSQDRNGVWSWSERCE